MTIAPLPTADILARAAAARDAERLEVAVALYRQAIDADPTAPDVHHHLGWVLGRLGRLQEAEAAYRSALELAPGAPSTASALGQLLLSQGRYDEGFAFFEARFDLTPQRAKPNLPFPEWRGEDVAGKSVLIWIEQGFGDQIQFARFAPILQARGADVTLVCLQPLERLFAASLGVRVIGASGAIEFPDPDVWTMTGSTAWRLGVTVQDIPAQPYLRAVGPRPALPPGFKVGLMTAGSPHLNDARRSLPPAGAARLATIDATVIDLSPASTGARDFADTAAIIEQLDLVICVDTSVAHLAGAMGKPCWVLLPAMIADWRWLRDREDSPWYPSARLYRQATFGDWNEVIDRVAADVRTLRDGTSAASSSTSTGG